MRVIGAFLGHEGPGAIRENDANSWGIARDEFPGNAKFPHCPEGAMSECYECILGIGEFFYVAIRSSLKQNLVTEIIHRRGNFLALQLEKPLSFGEA
jgi:hypothetical protein